MVVEVLFFERMGVYLVPNIGTLWSALWAPAS